MDQLIIRGAREHNLKDVSLDLPRDSLIVFTGLSGSGKSSLAFDTIFAEGQRRYVESLSAYARQFLGQMDKPDVDFIEGLSPGGLDRPEVHLEEPPLDGRHHHRGLRLPPPALRPDRPPPLPDLRRPDRAADAPADRRPGPRPRGRPAVPGAGPGHPRPQGRVRRAVPPAPDPGLLAGPGQRRDPHARLAARPSTSRRSTRSRSWSTGWRSRSRPSAGSPTRSRRRSTSPSGLVLFDFVDLDAKDPGRELRFSEKMACPNEHPIDTDELEPRSFSFNSPFGACPDCHGLGTRMEVDPELVVPNPQATLGEGAIQPWSQAHVADYFLRLMGALGDELGFDLNTPWEDLTDKAQKSLLHGHATKVHVVTRNRYGRERAYYAEFEGVTELHRAPSPRGRVRHQPRAVRGLHARGAVPRLRRQPPQAGVDVGDHRRPEHRRRVCRCRSTRPPTSCARSTCRRARSRSASGCSRRSRSGSTSCSTSASTTSPSTGRPARCPAARRSGSGSPPRSAPAWSACSTSSTSPRSGSTSATTTG